MAQNEKNCELSQIFSGNADAKLKFLSICWHFPLR